MICTNCKTPNSSDSKFCISCGSPLKASTNICSNGHVYDSSLTKCPYCPSPDLKERIGSSKNFGFDSTETFASSGSKTSVMSTASSKGNKTVIVAPGGESGDSLSKPVRKIVGWLVTFTWRQEGEDFKIFEGRNLLSADSKADICVSDPAVSTPHCMILYRGGKLLIKDELSTNGTFLNGEAIEEGELKDGDILKVGTTELKFRSIN